MKTQYAAKLAALITALVLSTSSWAYMVGTTDVGGVDSIFAHNTLADSSAAGEEAWVESLLGYDVAISYKNDATSWSLVNGETSIYASGLSSPTAYYIVKFGNGGISGLDSHYLYQNLDELMYAVIDLDLVSTAHNFNIGRVSHVTEFGAGTTDVPEPGTLMLLGLGLLGMLGASVRSKKS
ncbi:MAG TPA: PEP-CTERM sorting domain-containing protein [Pseudomonadales bacterium]